MDIEYERFFFVRVYHKIKQVGLCGKKSRIKKIACAYVSRDS